MEVPEPTQPLATRAGASRCPPGRPCRDGRQLVDAYVPGNFTQTDAGCTAGSGGAVPVYPALSEKKNCFLCGNAPSRSHAVTGNAITSACFAPTARSSRAALEQCCARASDARTFSLRVRRRPCVRASVKRLECPRRFRCRASRIDAANRDG